MSARAHASRRANRVSKPATAAASKRARAAAKLPRIAVLNRSTVMPDAAVQRITAALQTQVDRDFVAIWGAGARLQFQGPGGSKGGHEWVSER